MTWEELISRQQKELIDHAAYFIESRKQLLSEQEETLQHCNFTGEKGREIINRIFSQQKAHWDQQRKDEWDALLHAHEEEREGFRNRYGDNNFERLIQLQILEYEATHYPKRKQEKERDR
jgi:hypothetical protein